MKRSIVVLGLVLASTTACGGDDDGGGSGGSSSGGTTSGGSGGTSAGGSGGSTGGAAGASTGGAAGSSIGGAAGANTGGAAGSSTGGSGGSTGGTGGTGGSSGVSKDCNGQTFVASCKVNSGGGCTDYYGSGWTTSTVQQGCETGGNGTYSTSKCVTTSNVGACASSIAATSCTVTWSFSPITTNAAQQICSATSGTFYPP